MSPDISVVMSVYNGERYLAQAVESILSQTCTDFEFLIIDDFSSDSTPEILRNFAKKDERIRLIQNEVNIGLTHSLNKAIALAAGRYIARIDADDVSLPGRLENQVRFLENHPTVGVIGCWYQEIDADNQALKIRRLPVDPIVVRWDLCFRNPFAHSAVMFCRNLFEQVGGYDPQVTYAQDYDLWARLSRFTRLANLPEVYIQLRKHTVSITSSKRELQRQSSLAISQRGIQQVLGEPIPLKIIDWLCQRHTSGLRMSWVAPRLMVRICRAILSEQPNWDPSEQKLLVEYVCGQMVNKFRQNPTRLYAWPGLLWAWWLSPPYFFTRLAKKLRYRPGL